MRITRFKHSCLLVEDGGVTVLLDPGSFSDVPADLPRLDALLVTHAHADHLDPDAVARVMERHPDARVVCDEGSAEPLAAYRPQVVRDGDTVDLGMTVTIHGRQHAQILPEIPQIPNVGYLLGGRLFHPGDAFTIPPHEVEILALPIAAPWLRVSDSAQYVRDISPRVVVPIHECVAAVPEIYYRTLSGPIGDVGARFVHEDAGVAADV